MKILLLYIVCVCCLNNAFAQNIFPSSGNAGIGTLQPAAALQVIGNGRIGNATNYLGVDSTGNVSFTGKAGYKVGADKYAFQYSGNANYGLFFSASNLRYEFRNGTATPVFYIQADKGDATFKGKIFLDSSVYMRGSRFITTSDTGNLFIGSNAGFINGGSYNTSAGFQTLNANTAGYVNTAVGSFALYTNSTGRANTAMGAYALYSNFSSEANSATGAYALYNNKTGDGNTATGVNAMYANVDGYHNTATGVSSLYNNSNGAFASAHGFEALYFNTTGSYNTADAYHALYNNTTGSNNVAIGVRALNTNKSGSGNTGIGTNANVASANLNNATAIGYNAVVNASNKVVIGNTSVTVIGGQVGWSTLSDKRFKKDIQQNVPGLIFIDKLKPVTYRLDVKKYTNFLGIENLLQPDNNASIVHTGFIAQEVEKTAKEIGYEFNGVQVPQNEQDNYSIVYADFVPSLVKAVQELSAENKELQKEIAEIKAILAGIQYGSNIDITDAATKAPVIITRHTLVEQNMPNPCKATTIIPYKIGASVKDARICIIDVKGIMVFQQKIVTRKNQLLIDVSALAAGMYSYYIIADNVITESRKMMVVK